MEFMIKIKNLCSCSKTKFYYYASTSRFAPCWQS